MDALELIEEALKEFDNDLALRTQLNSVSEVSRNIHLQIARYLRMFIERERARQPQKRKRKGMLFITKLKETDPPEWIRRVREALKDRTVQAAAVELDVSFTTMKRFKAELEKVEKEFIGSK